MSLSSFILTADSQVGKNGTTYEDWFGYSGDWCAMFVSWCANEAGILTTNSTAQPPYVYKTASVGTMKDWYNNNHRAFAISSSPTSPNFPKPGDLVTIRPTATGVDHGHIGIVVSTSGSTITTVEGNLWNSAQNQSIVEKVNYTNLLAGGFGTLLWVLSNHTSW